MHGIRNGEGFCIEGDCLAIGRIRARGVDVHGDHLVVLVVEVEQLRDDEFGDTGHERHAHVDDAIRQQERRQVRRRSDFYTREKREERREKEICQSHTVHTHSTLIVHTHTHTVHSLTPRLHVVAS